MSTISDQLITPELAALARNTGLILRSLDSRTVSELFTKIEEYDPHECADTFEYLKHALNEPRASVGAEPVYSE